MSFLKSFVMALPTLLLQRTNVGHASRAELQHQLGDPSASARGAARQSHEAANKVPVRHHVARVH